MILQIALVTITGAQPNQAGDLQTANDVYASQCGIFVELADGIEVDRPDLLVLDQTDCQRTGHDVSADEDELSVSVVTLVLTWWATTCRATPPASGAVRRTQRIGAGSGLAISLPNGR